MNRGTDSNWMGVSDMMSGLMMVFLFISVVFMQQIEAEKEAVERIALTYKNYQEELYKSLLAEFGEDLDAWDASILSDGTIRFREPDVLFDKGSKDIKPRFKQVLSEFFPRYIKLVSNPRYRQNIDEVRIEGHTSSGWNDTVALEDRYLSNAQLAQQRSLAILKYCFRLNEIQKEREWLTTVLRANGLAFAKPILVNGKEDTIRSRRVEFKVRTRAEEKITEILRSLKSESSPQAL